MGMFDFYHSPQKMVDGSLNGDNPACNPGCNHVKDLITLIPKEVTCPGCLNSLRARGELKR